MLLMTPRTPTIALQPTNKFYFIRRYHRARKTDTQFYSSYPIQKSGFVYVEHFDNNFFGMGCRMGALGKVESRCWEWPLEWTLSLRLGWMPGQFVIQ